MASPYYTGGGEDLTLDLSLVREFETMLQAVTPVSVYGLPDLTPHVNHMGLPTTPPIRLAAGMFIDRVMFGNGPDLKGVKPEAWDFTFQSWLRLGRELSRNKVFFGKVKANWPERGDSTETQVAVKPLSDVGALLGELAMFQYIESLNLPTFEPHSILVARNRQNSHLLTYFRGPVETIDAKDWDSLQLGEQWSLFNYSIETAAEVNSHLLFHKDLAPRNVATNETNKIVIVDPEFAVSAKELGEIALSARNANTRQWATNLIKEKMVDELKVIWESADRYILAHMPIEQRPAEIKDKYRHYEKHIFKPYKKALIAKDSKYLPVLLAAYDLMMREIKQGEHINQAGA